VEIDLGIDQLFGHFHAGFQIGDQFLDVAQPAVVELVVAGGLGAAIICDRASRFSISTCN